MKKSIIVLAISTLIIISSSYAMILEILHFDIFIFVVAYGCLFWIVAFVEMIRIGLKDSNTNRKNSRFHSFYKNRSF